MRKALCLKVWHPFITVTRSRQDTEVLCIDPPPPPQPLSIILLIPSPAKTVGCLSHILAAPRSQNLMSLLKSASFLCDGVAQYFWFSEILPLDLFVCFWCSYSTIPLQPRGDWTGSESKTSVCMCRAKFSAATVRLGGISPLTPVGWDTFDSWQLPSVLYFCFFQWPTKASAWERYPIIRTLRLRPHCKIASQEFPALIDLCHFH